jgi:DNA-binding transcriptional MerR regulator
MDGYTGYTVRRLARIAGVSVRTLHHYDRIGLLAPRARTGSGYRLYGEAELLRLQQILFYRELDFPLPEIARILDDPDFDPVQALRGHRIALEGRLGRLHRLLKTLDQTIAKYEGGNMLKDEELYAGFAPERIAAIKAEARERWGARRVEESERRLRSMPKERFEAVSREGDAVNRDLAALMGRDPADPEVRAAVERHHAWIRHFWTPDAESYRGLGLHYAEHPEFRAYYDKYAPGLADFLRDAIARYCEDFPA